MGSREKKYKDMYYLFLSSIFQDSSSESEKMDVRIYYQLSLYLIGRDADRRRVRPRCRRLGEAGIGEGGGEGTGRGGEEEKGRREEGRGKEEGRDEKGRGRIEGEGEGKRKRRGREWRDKK